MAVTKAQKMEALRKEAIEKFQEPLADTFQTDTGSFAVKLETGVVEVKFIVKGDDYDVAEAVEAYGLKLKAQADRLAEASKKKAEREAKKAKK